MRDDARTRELVREERDVAKAAQTVEQENGATLEQRLPELLDDVLGRLSEVGVERILELARRMVEARFEQSPVAHLAPGQTQRN